MPSIICLLAICRPFRLVYFTQTGWIVDNYQSWPRGPLCDWPWCISILDDFLCISYYINLRIQRKIDTKLV